MAGRLPFAAVALALLGVAGCFDDGGFASSASLSYHGDNAGDHEKVITCPAGRPTDLVVTIKGDSGQVFVVVSVTTGDSNEDGVVRPDEDRYDFELFAKHYSPSFAEQTYLETVRGVGGSEENETIDYRLFVERSDPFHGKYKVTLECT